MLIICDTSDITGYDRGTPEQLSNAPPQMALDAVMPV